MSECRLKELATNTLGGLGTSQFDRDLSSSDEPCADAGQAAFVAVHLDVAPMMPRPPDSRMTVEVGPDREWIRSGGCPAPHQHHVDRAHKASRTGQSGKQSRLGRPAKAVRPKPSQFSRRQVRENHRVAGEIGHGMRASLIRGKQFSDTVDDGKLPGRGTIQQRSQRVLECVIHSIETRTAGGCIDGSVYVLRHVYDRQASQP